jgi:hypothetical protein
MLYFIYIFLPIDSQLSAVACHCIASYVSDVCRWACPSPSCCRWLCSSYCSQRSSPQPHWLYPCLVNLCSSPWSSTLSGITNQLLNSEGHSVYAPAISHVPGWVKLLKQLILWCVRTYGTLEVADMVFQVDRRTSSKFTVQTKFSMLFIISASVALVRVGLQFLGYKICVFYPVICIKWKWH